MKIAIDITSIVYGTGVSTYAKELTTSIIKISKNNDFILFAGAWKQTQIIKDWYSSQNFGENVCLKILPIPPRAQTMLWNDLHLINLEWLIGSFDIYHSLDWSLAPSRFKSIATVHDLYFLKCPENQRHPYSQSLYNRLLLALKKKIPIIAVSETTKSDLVTLLNYPTELVTVIYEGPPKISSFDQSMYHSLRQKLTIKDKYLVFVGTLEPRKNLIRLIKAFSLINQSEYSLLIIGRAGWEESLEETSNVIFSGYMPDRERDCLISNSAGLLYPSLYEGFGLPILQAFELKVPILTSNVSSMPEVAGDAAIYVEPEDINSIRAGIEMLMNINEKQYKQRTRMGQDQLMKFSWDITARKTLDIYKKFR